MSVWKQKPAKINYFCTFFSLKLNTQKLTSMNLIFAICTYYIKLQLAYRVQCSFSKEGKNQSALLKRAL